MILSEPTVSLLIAMRNEENFIAGCIESIFSQSYPKEKMEVFIIDGMSSDSSWIIVEQIIQGKDNFHILQNPKITQSAAWNLGIENSKGDLITIVSAHSTLASDYVANAIETYIRTGADMVGGAMTAIGEGKIAEAVSIATTNPFGMGGARFHYTNEEEIVDTVYMGFCSRNLFVSVGGFDEEMIRNQDDELSYRILDYGGTIICNPAIKSHYFNRATFKSLWRQYYQYGFYKVRVMQKHPQQMRIRQYVPPVFVLGLFGSIILTLFPAFKILSIILPILYLIANLIASTITAAKKGWKYLPLLPLIFAILHVSYGSGFLVGLVKFASRWGDKVGKVPSFHFIKDG